jgi:hypothetical protein
MGVRIIIALSNHLMNLDPLQVSEMTFDYTHCKQLTAQTSGTSPTFTQMPNFNYRLRSKDAKAPFNPPQCAFINSSSPSQQAQCIIQFDIPADLLAIVLLYIL